MALTLNEQLSLFGLTVGDKKLIDLVFQGGVNYSIQFYDGVKTVTPDTDEASYKSKMLSVCNQVIRAEANSNRGLINTLERVFISVVGLSGSTYAQATGATPTQWNNFITTNIKEVFENLAGVTNQEATAYNAV